MKNNGEIEMKMLTPLISVQILNFDRSENEE